MLTGNMATPILTVLLVISVVGWGLSAAALLLNPRTSSKLQSALCMLAFAGMAFSVLIYGGNRTAGDYSLPGLVLGPAAMGMLLAVIARAAIFVLNPDRPVSMLIVQQWTIGAVTVTTVALHAARFELAEAAFLCLGGGAAWLLSSLAEERRWRELATYEISSADWR